MTTRRKEKRRDPFHLEKPEWKIVNAIHDELLFSVPDSDVGEAKKIIEHVMVTTSSKYSKIPVPVEFAVGDSWEK